MDSNVRFMAMRQGTIRWWACSIYPDGVIRKEIGPFWRWVAAERAAQCLRQHFKTGLYIGRDNSVEPPTASRQKDAT